VFSRWRQPPPPPPKKWFQQPALILTIVAMFVLGPVGVIYNSMSEELKDVRSKVEAVEKEKVDNENLKETLNELKEQRKEQTKSDKEQNESIQTNQMAIKEILIRQEVMEPKEVRIKQPAAKKKSTVKMAPKKTEAARASGNTMSRDSAKKLQVRDKRVLTPEMFERYLEMKPEIQAKYKRYLKSRGYDVEGL